MLKIVASLFKCMFCHFAYDELLLLFALILLSDAELWLFVWSGSACAAIKITKILSVSTTLFS